MYLMLINLQGELELDIIVFLEESTLWELKGLWESIKSVKQETSLLSIAATWPHISVTNLSINNITVLF